MGKCTIIVFYSIGNVYMSKRDVSVLVIFTSHVRGQTEAEEFAPAGSNSERKE